MFEQTNKTLRKRWSSLAILVLFKTGCTKLVIKRKMLFIALLKLFPWNSRKWRERENHIGFLGCFVVWRFLFKFYYQFRMPALWYRWEWWWCTVIRSNFRDKLKESRKIQKLSFVALSSNHQKNVIKRQYNKITLFRCNHKDGSHSLYALPSLSCCQFFSRCSPCLPFFLHFVNPFTHSDTHVHAFVLFFLQFLHCRIAERGGNCLIL